MNASQQMINELEGTQLLKQQEKKQRAKEMLTRSSPSVILHILFFITTFMLIFQFLPGPDSLKYIVAILGGVVDCLAMQIIVLRRQMNAAITLLSADN